MTLAEFIAALNAKFATVNGFAGYTFEVDAGYKYDKVVQLSPGQRSVYCFVDEDGNIYKAAGWSKPAKGVRANLATLNMDDVDAYGSWLYR